MKSFFTAYQYILGIVVVIILAVVCWATFPFAQNASQQHIPAVQQPVDISSWQTYRNEELGFEMKIPPTWKEYKIEEKASEPGFGSVIFSRKVEWINKVGDVSFSEHMVLGITVATPQWWEAVSESPTDRPILIKTVNQKVYVYRKDQDGNKNDADEIVKVLSTFKLTP